MQFIPGFKQVLTRDGWINIEDYYNRLKRAGVQILVLYKGRCIYTDPISFAQTYYKGLMKEITTDTSRVILEPSVKLIEKTTNELVKGDRLERVHLFQVIEKIDSVMWEGNRFCLTFPKPVLIPVKFESDYILIPS